MLFGGWCACESSTTFFCFDKMATLGISFFCVAILIQFSDLTGLRITALKCFGRLIKDTYFVPVKYQ